MDVDEAGVRGPPRHDVPDALVPDAVVEVDDAAQVVASTDVVRGEDPEPSEPPSNVHSADQRPMPHRCWSAMDAARSSAASSVSTSRSPQTTQWAASTSARALAVLKPSSRRARGSTPSISEGSGPAGGVPSDGPECLGQPVQHGDDNRERQLLAGDRVRQALEDGREIGGLARDISPPTEPERGRVPLACRSRAGRRRCRPCDATSP